MRKQKIWTGIFAMNQETFIHVIAALSATGRPSKSVLALQLALERKPRNVRLQADLARAYLYADRVPDAIAQARKAYALSPSHLAARYWLLQSLALTGAHDEAIEIAESFLIDMPNEPLFLGALGIAYAKAGRETDARAALKLMQSAPTSQDRNPYQQAQVLAQLGDVDAAIDSLELASDDGNYSVVNLGIDPSLRGLHGNVRFVALAKKLRLTDYFAPNESLCN